MPTPMRAISSIAKPRAAPVNAVIALQTTIPSAMIVRREPVSAQRAIGMPAKV
jgi:hypothetical protein